MPDELKISSLEASIIEFVGQAIANHNQKAFICVMNIAFANLCLLSIDIIF